MWPIANIANAKVINKCKSTNGFEYTDRACTDAVKVEPVHTLSPAPHSVDQQSARKRAASDKAELVRLETARHRDEYQIQQHHQKQRQHLARQRRRCDDLLLRQKWLNEDRRMAGNKASRGISIKTLRLNERLAVECNGYRPAQLPKSE